MSPRRWIFLLIFYISYLMFGASIYYHIEHNLEKHRRADALQERIQMNEYLVDELKNKDQSKQNEILEKITGYCGKSVTNYTLDAYEDPYIWSFYHSLFFAFTVCSTVGYGNISPTTTLGRMIMIIYSLIGIPINGILFAGLGEYFSRTFIGIYNRYKKYKMSNDARYVPRQFGLFATIGIAFLPGMAFFIILPSCLFSYFENWPFSLSIYYSYVTTTTIGFGDYVPTFQPHQERQFGGWFIFYQIFIIVWFISSLGYLVMIMSFITKGLQSKKLSALEHQLSHNIRQTQTRIWHGVTKDVGYLRRILNELYIMKFKPVYNEPGGEFQLPRSISCPELTMYRIDPPVVSRKRAFSECYDERDQIEGTPMVKGSSETDLSRINKQKTFETAEAFKHTTDLLAKVVTALANMHPPEEQCPTVGSAGMFGGYHGFSDSDILASEWSFPSINDIPRRERSCSDFYLNEKERPVPNEWTWSGDNLQIQQAINNRVKGVQESFQMNLDYSSCVVNMGNEPKKKKKFSIPDAGNFLKRLFPFKGRTSSQDLSKKDRKFSIASVPETPEKFVPPQINHYSTITGGQSAPFFGFDRKKNLFTAPYGDPTIGYSNGDGKRSPIFNMFDQRPPPPFSPPIERRNDHLYTVEPNRRNNLLAQAISNDRSKGAQGVNPGLRERRTSLFTQNPNKRKISLLTPQPIRRGSMFPDPGSRTRRPSLFSVPYEDEINTEVLENTTIADLIRAIELMHTHATLNEPPAEFAKKKTRKLGNAGVNSPPPVFSLFPPEFDQNPMSTSRAYSRRSTIVGNFSPQSPQVTRRMQSRRTSASQLSESPPPSYKEKETPKFKRRFSIRPTNLQTPPGKAPPLSQSQTVFQRRPSLRPSPLAREIPTEGSTLGTTPSATPTASTRPPSRFNVVQTNINRGGTSSTHSPLSRIVQITQAARTADSLSTEKSKSDQK